ncbi:MAG TPA: chloride channel protein [Thermodesulfobacteriota bacterium]|nr:chloride channel protein [Thermodesulfobacteriota bacterium]
MLSGGVLLVVLSFLFHDEVIGYGFPKFLEKINLRGGILRPKETIAKALGSCVTLGFGGSAGQEGPIAQLGGAVGSFIGQIFKVSRGKIRVFVACGFAAGIAATFNAPVAGVLFAEEIALLRDFKVGSFLPIVISSAVGTVVSHALRGNEPVFRVPPYEFVNINELFFYAAFGVLLGVFASGFIKLFLLAEERFSRFKTPFPVKAASGRINSRLYGDIFPLCSWKRLRPSGEGPSRPASPFGDIGINYPKALGHINNPRIRMAWRDICTRYFYRGCGRKRIRKVGRFYTVEAGVLKQCIRNGWDGHLSCGGDPGTSHFHISDIRDDSKL